MRLNLTILALLISVLAFGQDTTKGTYTPVYTPKSIVKPRGAFGPDSVLLAPVRQLSKPAWWVTGIPFDGAIAINPTDGQLYWWWNGEARTFGSAINAILNQDDSSQTGSFSISGMGDMGFLMLDAEGEGGNYTGGPYIANQDDTVQDAAFRISGGGGMTALLIAGDAANRWANGKLKADTALVTKATFGPGKDTVTPLGGAYNFAWNASLRSAGKYTPGANIPHIGAYTYEQGINPSGWAITEIFNSNRRSYWNETFISSFGQDPNSPVNLGVLDLAVVTAYPGQAVQRTVGKVLAIAKQTDTVNLNSGPSSLFPLTDTFNAYVRTMQNGNGANQPQLYTHTFDVKGGLWNKGSVYHTYSNPSSSFYTSYENYGYYYTGADSTHTVNLPDPTIAYNSGREIPLFNYGTYQIKLSRAVYTSVVDSIKTLSNKPGQNTLLVRAIGGKWVASSAGYTSEDVSKKAASMYSTVPGSYPTVDATRRYTDSADAAVISYVDKSLNNNIPPRLNAAENTTNPAIFKANTESTNLIGITIEPDYESPTKGYIPYKRVFNNTLLPVPGTKTASNAIPAGTQAARPKVVTISYWMKVVDIQTLWTGSMVVYLGNRDFTYDVRALLAAPGTIQSVYRTAAITEYSEATLHVSIPEVNNGFAKIVQQFDSISWNSSWSGVNILYQFIMSGRTAFYNYPTSIYNLTVLHKAIDNSVLIYPDPAGAYAAYPYNIAGLNQQVTNINTKLSGINSSGDARYYYLNGSYYHATPFNETQDLVRVFDMGRVNSVTDANNPDINMVGSRLIPKGSSDLTSTATSLKNSADDICPVFVNASYIGGNHGWAHARQLTLTAHGKTVADIGARYQDGAGKMFTIVRVPDANTLIVCSDNQAVDGYTYTFVSPSGTLTYQSSGNSTTSISGYTVAGYANLRTTMAELSKNTLVNGKTVAIPGTVTSCNFTDLTESYDILDLPSILSMLTVNRPIGGYTSNVDLTTLGADKLLNHAITYRLLPNGTTLIFHNFFLYKKLVFSFHGFTQCGPMSACSLYIPNTLPINDGVMTRDFRSPVDWSSGPATDLQFTPSYWENSSNPPNRFLMASTSVKLHSGYLTDRGVGELRKTDTSYLTNAGFLATTRKVYPFGLSKLGAMEAGSSFTAVAYRQWTNPAANPSGRTNYSWFELDGKTYVWLDYHSSITDRITMPTEWQGRKITIAEKTANVSVLGSVVTSELTVQANISSGGYGYVALVLDNAIRKTSIDSTSSTAIIIGDGHWVSNSSSANSFKLKPAAQSKGATAHVDNIGSGTLNVVTTGSVNEIYDRAIPGTANSVTVSGGIDLYCNGTYWIVR